jgi:hypothetical protein
LSATLYEDCPAKRDQCSSDPGVRQADGLVRLVKNIGIARSRSERERLRVALTWLDQGTAMRG